MIFLHVKKTLLNDQDFKYFFFLNVILRNTSILRTQLFIPHFSL